MDNRTIFRVMDKETTDTLHPDERKAVYLLPRSVVWKQGKVSNEEVLLTEREPQISLAAHEPFVMDSSDGPASLLLDFGYEIHGGIRILAWQDSTGRGAKVRVRFGESVMEAMSEPGGEGNATNDHARRDIHTEIGMMSMNRIGETGFRFVRLDLEEKDVQLSLKSVAGVLVYKDVPYQGSFSCSDPLLNRIWDVGAYTVHLNMQEYIWDGIKRDRLVWVGDMHPETLTIRTVFGADASVAGSLDFIRKETPLPGWMNGMASYTMWYAVIVYDWFLYTGDRAWLKNQEAYLEGISRQLTDCIGADGKDTVTEGRFLDWPSSDKPEAVDAGVQALHRLAADRLHKLFLILGKQELAERCERDVERLGRFPVASGGSKQAAALLVLAGLREAGEMNREILSVGGAQGMSTFMGYYILTARGMAGDYEGCLSCIRDYWGGMLKLGATTFWEDFDINWMEAAAPIDRLPAAGETDVHGTYGAYCYKGYRHSLCHGWASGVTPWLTENILGVRIVKPGCRVLEIKPHLGDLSWAKGTFPTPMGIVHISHKKRKDGSVETKIKAPAGVTVLSGT